MAILKEYKTLEEKKTFFWNGDFKISQNVDSIFKKLEEMKDTENFIFRGCSEAKFKIFNSAQRHYITHELDKHDDGENHYENFISNLIEETKHWNRETVQTLFNSMGVHTENCLAYLSFMQHYGIPSPLVDFTLDPYVALFFAIDGIKFSPSDNEIDNYFSIYSVLKKTAMNQSWSYVFEKNVHKEDGSIPYSAVASNTLALILPENPAFKILNNTNIVNQKGVFVYSNQPFTPIEETFYEYAGFMEEHFGKTRFEKEFLGHYEFGTCYNIHKSMIPYILDVLRKKGISKEYIYPDVWKMKEQVLSEATNKILVTKR